MNLDQLDRLANSYAGLALLAAVELGLAYWVFWLAIDSGNLLEYLVLLVLILMAVRNLVKLIRKLLTKRNLNGRSGRTR